MVFVDCCLVFLCCHFVPFLSFGGWGDISKADSWFSAEALTTSCQCTWVTCHLVVISYSFLLVPAKWLVRKTIFALVKWLAVEIISKMTYNMSSGMLNTTVPMSYLCSNNNNNNRDNFYGAVTRIPIQGHSKCICGMIISGHLQKMSQTAVLSAPIEMPIDIKELVVHFKPASWPMEMLDG